ncbi:unnamed protein product [Linum tenue]|uniref:AP complex mu/sigma subunit domain-containing protein n=1 Tax=Linum tenue TaxID=586396 RepID=A0AAV0QB67_9ROSI|nr:unnamed protein product [Linum tenue]
MHVIRVQALTKLNTHGPTSSKNRWLFLSNACFFSSPNRTEISARIILSLGLPSPELGTAGAYSQLRRQSWAFGYISLSIHFVCLISRQGKVRLTKWYSTYTQKERSKGVCLSISSLSTLSWCRYASLYFCMCIDDEDNELEALEVIHHFVEILDRYFGSVCELDLIFNFHKAYYILDELLIAGELQESSKKTVAKLISAQDSLVEVAKEEASSISNIIAQATK